MSKENKDSQFAEGGDNSLNTPGNGDNSASQTKDTEGKPADVDKSTGENAEGGDISGSKEKDGDADGETSLVDAFAISLGLKDEPKIESLLDTVDFNGIIKYIKDYKATNIITMAGAGISTSAGIPDFRSPETGLYDNLQKYNLPDPTAVFSIDYFRENPEPFFMLSRELWPGTFKPTLCHYFIRLLNDKGLLLRHYTQNIDTLDTVAGLNPEKVVEAHGHFRTGHCLQCKAEYSQDWMKERIMKPSIPKCTEEGCEGVVKPDIVFFGESLPARFGQLVFEDFPKCDLLIIMGTSLVVQPFASLANRTKQQVPRLYINLENSCPPKLDPIMSVIFGKGFDFDGENNYRDVFWQGTCDNGCETLADELGWGDELRNLIKTEHAKIDAANPDQSRRTPKKEAASATNAEIPPEKAESTQKKETTSKPKTPAKEIKSTSKKETASKTKIETHAKKTTPKKDAPQKSGSESKITPKSNSGNAKTSPSSKK